MAVSRDFIPTPEFAEDVFLVRRALGKRALAAFDQHLGNVCDRLLADGFHIASSHGSLGEEFEIAIDANYILVFRWITDRDGQGVALAEHAELMKLERI